MAETQFLPTDVNTEACFFSSDLRNQEMEILATLIVIHLAEKGKTWEDTFTHEGLLQQALTTDIPMAPGGMAAQLVAGFHLIGLIKGNYVTGNPGMREFTVTESFLAICRKYVN